MTDKQPNALRLAEGNEECAKAWLESSDAHKFRMDTATELRRLHAENEALRKCAVKYLKWLNIRDPKKSLEGDLTDPEMLK